ncbi:hypothetical protein [Paraconexibacter sp. AEG42_29]
MLTPKWVAVAAIGLLVVALAFVGLWVVFDLASSLDGLARDD